MDAIFGLDPNPFLAKDELSKFATDYFLARHVVFFPEGSDETAVFNRCLGRWQSGLPNVNQAGQPQETQKNSIIIVRSKEDLAQLKEQLERAVHKCPEHGTV